MFPANAFSIRTASEADDAALARLAVLNHRAPISRPALIGEIDGIPAAAISLDDERIVADPFAATPHLHVHLRMRAAGIAAHRRTPSVARRMRAALPIAA